MAERRNHGQFLTRTSHGHVQSSPSPFRKQRSEVVRWIASPILPITDTNDDHVTLIPLNALQILDEETVHSCWDRRMSQSLDVPPGHDREQLGPGSCGEFPW